MCFALLAAGHGRQETSLGRHREDFEALDEGRNWRRRSVKRLARASVRRRGRIPRTRPWALACRGHGEAAPGDESLRLAPCGPRLALWHRQHHTSVNDIPSDVTNCDGIGKTPPGEGGGGEAFFRRFPLFRRRGRAGEGGGDVFVARHQCLSRWELITFGATALQGRAQRRHGSRETSGACRRPRARFVMNRTLTRCRLPSRAAFRLPAGGDRREGTALQSRQLRKK